ncbi:hypothetical protein GQX73_g3848 [Xylaria multiplex]|uniref:Uncharacterized protein n=1 Tax=Xylaria multiplex TaxID=323545 RepID=A0A7C8MZX1_9PEZI|nr:hypothetical protein GQX73_g3848 [Xylaria multiplex]
MEPSNVHLKASITKQQLYGKRPSYMGSSENLRKPIALRDPRPPTPGPRPGPLPPRPGPPTPPPSPRYRQFRSSIDQQSSILVSRAEPSQYPHPNPPPSPGPGRPGPVNPPPNVPTPPPSPRRSASPWVFSDSSSLLALAVTYLSLATWNGDADPAHVRMAAEHDIYSQRRSNSLVPKTARSSAAIRSGDAKRFSLAA